MVNTLNVKPSEMKPVDFNRFDIAATYEIETCIAVGTLEQHLRRGTLSHLKLTDSLEEFFRFMEQNAPTDSKVYLVGGWRAGRVNVHPMQPQAQSEDYLHMIIKGLETRDYRIAGKDVLHGPGEGRHMLMRHGQPVEVQLYKKIRTPLGMRNMDAGYITLG